jgi:hypothetical protein
MNTIITSRIGFFFGAGSSIELEIPSMKQMTTSFAKKMRSKEGKNEEREIFDLIYNSLNKIYGEEQT